MYRIAILTILLLVLSFSPVVMVINKDSLQKTFQLSGDDSFKLVLAVFPLIFSLMILLFNLIIASYQRRRQERSELLNLINSRNDSFNTILVKTNNRLNALGNEHRHLFMCLEVLQTAKQFSNIISYWKSRTHETLDLCNTGEFREYIHCEVVDLAKSLESAYESNVALKQLRFLQLVHSQTGRLDVKDQVFIFSLRNYVKNDEREKKVFSAFGIHSNISSQDSLFNSLLARIAEYAKYYETNANGSPLVALALVEAVESCIIPFFAFLESIEQEIVLIDEFQNTLSKCYSKYYSDEKRNFKQLSDIVHLNKSPGISSIVQFVNRDALFNNLGIN